MIAMVRAACNYLPRWLVHWLFFGGIVALWSAALAITAMLPAGNVLSEACAVYVVVGGVFSIGAMIIALVMRNDYLIEFRRYPRNEHRLNSMTGGMLLWGYKKPHSSMSAARASFIAHSEQYRSLKETTEQDRRAARMAAIAQLEQELEDMS